MCDAMSDDLPVPVPTSTSPLSLELQNVIDRLYDLLRSQRRTERVVSEAARLLHGDVQTLLGQLADTERAYADLQGMLAEKDAAISSLTQERNYARELASAQSHRFEVMLHALNATVGMLDAAGSTVREARSRISGVSYEPPPYRPEPRS